jgi:hypothetical protein
MPNLRSKVWKPSKGDNIIRLSEKHFPCYVPDILKGKPALQTGSVCTHNTQVQVEEKILLYV